MTKAAKPAAKPKAKADTDPATKFEVEWPENPDAGWLGDWSAKQDDLPDPISIGKARTFYNEKRANALADSKPSIDTKKLEPASEDDADVMPEPESDDASTEADRLPSEADQAAMNADARAMLDNATDATSPMSLADVNAILADNYPGYTPIDPRGTAAGLQFTLPDGKSINVQRKRVKACANMEELRAYVGGLL